MSFVNSLLLIFCCLVAGQASAQNVGTTNRPKLLHSLTHACAADYARLCPQTDPPLQTGQTELICLKDHKVDVSLGCRRAINAIRH